MQNEIRAAADALTDFEVADVTFDEREFPPLQWRYQLPEFLKVLFFAGRKIVEPEHSLVELEQRFDNVRADEAGGAGDEPGFWLVLQIGFQFFVGRHLNSTRDH